MLNGARMVNPGRVLVTGGAGFIGRAVVRALPAEGTR
jgi:nucleoside-diphosphate-sugar epimerase